MARFFRSSGCTAQLVRNLQALDVPDIHTFADVERLHGSIDGILAERRAQEEQLQRAMAAAARDGASMVEESIASRIRDREAQLAAERDGLPNEVEAVRSEIWRHPLKGLLRIPAWLRLRRRLRRLTNQLDREARRPFQSDLARLESLRFAAASLELDIFSAVESRVAPYTNAKRYLEENKILLLGARGEERVLDELRALPDDFAVISDVTVDLGGWVLWKARRGVRLRRAQIDHVVVGPRCVFLLETKNWSASTFEQMDFTPQEQVSRAAYIFYVLAYSRFGGRHMPRRDLVVLANDTTRFWTKLAPPHEFVTEVPLGALTSFIRGYQAPHAQGAVTPQETVDWLLSLT